MSKKKQPARISLKRLLTNDVPPRPSFPMEITLDFKNIKDGDVMTIPVPKMTLAEQSALTMYLQETYGDYLNNVGVGPH